ncbi:DNA damage-induced apoptosis suppressor protein isoform X2 [Trachinotus anak]
MSVRRALVDCAVLSVQDARVFYPCCKGCLSRVDVEQRDTTRCRCSRCGYSCVRDQVDYRYRLSLRVSRDRWIFGVTVFGTCLNPFFGINASGLQRLVENMDGPVGPSTRATLLMKAVEDCFIGRHFIFGIKVTGTESGLWFGGPVANGSSSRDTVQFIASQMILPKAAGLTGCTVVSYYQILLQKAAEYELGSTDPSKTSRPPETSLLLIPHQSPASSFSNDTISASGLFSLSPQRLQHQDCTLTPTPPWQQSLGLVTSSAEQEESCSTQ